MRLIPIGRSSAPGLAADGSALIVLAAVLAYGVFVGRYFMTHERGDKS